MTKTLNEIMEFDQVVYVVGGMAFPYDGPVYAPEVCDEQIYSDEWEFFSTGYTGQYGYNGPVMHQSEFIGGALERDILAEQGFYVAVLAYYTDEETEEIEPEGWVVLKKKEDK